MTCPKCKEEGKRKTGSSVRTSIPPFYKDGKFHFGDVEAERYECSNGHQWWEVVPKNVYCKASGGEFIGVKASKAIPVMDTSDFFFAGKKAGDIDFISKRTNLGAPGPVAGLCAPDTECLWCGKLFNLAMTSCGTGYTWSLYKCPHCEGLMADGRYIPPQAKNDPKIKIMKGGDKE